MDAAQGIFGKMIEARHSAGRRSITSFSPSLRMHFESLIGTASAIVRLTLAAAMLVILFVCAAAAQSDGRAPFNQGWLFQKGDPAAGEAPTRDAVRQWALVPTPENGIDLLFSQPAFDDSEWRSLDLPHDWAIEGPFDRDVNGEAARLPTAGVGWYRKHFDLDVSDAGKQIYIDFDGAMSHSAVWLNGKYVGGRPYGYSSFRLDLTPFINIGGRNVIAVRLDNPPDSSRWYTGAGIYRNVWLVKTAPVHVAHWGTYVTTPEATLESARVSATVTVDNRSATDAAVVVRTKIYSLVNGEAAANSVAVLPAQSAVIAAGSSQTVESGVEIENPDLWTIASPALYLAVTSVEKDGVVIDRYRTTFGIRRIAFDERGLILNGERVYLKGVCQHHDLGAIGAGFNQRALERQFDILQEMGVNAIRTSHNPPAPELLDLADRRGILIIDEAFDAWVKGKRANDYSTLFGDWHERDLRSMVRRDRNHPSIIMWSTGNEIFEQASPEGHAVSARLRDIVRGEDMTRPVTAAANMPEAGYNGFQKTVDVFGYNYKPEEYGRFRRANPAMAVYASESSSTISSRGEYFFPVPRERRNGFWDVDVTSSELVGSWWANALNGVRRPWPQRAFYQDSSAHRARPTVQEILDRGIYFMPELEDMAAGYTNFQISSYDQHRQFWATLADTEFIGQDQNPGVAGEFVWTGFDYLGETNPFDGQGATVSGFDDPELEAQVAADLRATRRLRVPQRSSYFGLIDLCGFKKDRYYLYQARWRPDLPMAHILPHWNWPERIGKVTPVHVYTAGDEAELFLNGRSLGRKRLDKYQYRFRWDDVIYEPGELKVAVYKNGERWAEDVVRTTGPVSQITTAADRNEINADGSDLSFITVRLADRSGVTVPRAKNRIDFTVNGPGEIIAIDNGDATDLEPFRSPSRRAFNGLALVVVRSIKGRTGRITVRAASPGLKSANTSILSKI